MDIPQPTVPTTPSTPPAQAGATAPVTLSPGPNPPAPSKKPVIIAGVVAGVALIAGGVALAAWQGWIPLFAQKPPTLEHIADAFQNIESARVKADVSVNIEPREEGVDPISIPEPEASEDTEESAGLGDAETADVVRSMLMSMIPTSVDASVTVNTVWQRGGEQDVDSETAIVGSMKTGGITADIDLAFKSIDGNGYVQVNSLPIPLIDTSELKNEWIAFPKGFGGIENIFSYEDPEVQVFGDAEETAEETGSDAEPDVSMQEDVRTLVRESLVSGAMSIVSTDPNAEVNERGAWRMTLTVDPDAFQTAVDTICLDINASEQDERPTHALFTEEFCEPPTEDESTALRELAKNFLIDVWIDKKTSTPVRFAFDLKIAPDASIEKLADKQLHVRADITLSDINKEIVVQVPMDTIKPKRAMQIISGQSEDEAAFMDQVKIVGDLRTALSSYYEEHQAYPDSLAGLMGTPQSRFFTPSPVVINIPNDQYTGEPFSYAVVGEDYELSYQMEIPETTTSFLIELQRSSYVDGTNTATSLYESREAEATKDSDEDGLTDAEEAELGTSAWLEDTDGDGFTDKEEVDGGYDPLAAPQP